MDLLGQLALLACGHARVIAALEMDAARGRLDKLLDHAPDHRFPTAGFAHQRQGFARVKIQADLFGGVDIVGDAARDVMAHGKAGRQVVQAQDRAALIGRVLHMGVAERSAGRGRCAHRNRASGPSPPRAVIDLPDPDFPTIARACPGIRSKSSPRTATLLPRPCLKDTVRSRTDKSGASPVGRVVSMSAAP